MTNKALSPEDRAKILAYLSEDKATLEYAIAVRKKDIAELTEELNKTNLAIDEISNS